MGLQKKGVPDNRAEIVCFTENFHGRTTTIVSFSTEEDYRDGFGPFTPGFQVANYGDIRAATAAINDHTVGVLIEPIQGEAGIVIPPDGYLRELAKLCRDRNVLLCVDEIQTGFGRTGKMFCYEHEGVKPDLLIVGKALGGGIYPVSAVVATDEVMSVFRPGEHGSTFGGNPLAAAIATCAMDVLVEERLTQRSQEFGDYLLERLRAIKSPYIDHIRGRGLFVGVVLREDAGGARPFCEQLMRLGILCKETHESVIRIAPPLTITKEELDWAIERIEQVLTGAVAQSA